jgi:hypothetical protein
MSKTLVAGMSVLGLMLAWSGPASAQQSKCLAGKTKCMSKTAGGLLKCEETAETPGKSADPTCRTKVFGKFDGGMDPTKGCFVKLENAKGSDCITTDPHTAEDALDSCVGAFVAGIDPNTVQSKCGVGKKKCVAKLLGSLLKCQAAAQTPGQDPNALGGCEDKAKLKYNGTDPTKGCFVKLENKTGNDCAPNPMGNSHPLQDDVTNCVTSLVNLETAMTTTTTTTTTTLPSHGMILNGALPQTLGRFNFAGDIGLPGALTHCHATFGAGTHVCTYLDLQSASAAGDLVGLQDITNMTVTGFWAIDNSAPDLSQCNDDAPGTGSGLNWEYGTAHTSSRAEKVAIIDNPLPPPAPAKILGPLQSGTTVFCSIGGTPSWVGCCH